MKSYAKLGGAAALIHGAALIAVIILAVVFIFPVMDAETGEYIEFIGANRGVMDAWILTGYWVTGASLVVMALALYDRMKSGSTVLIQTATVFGIIWAGLIIGSGNLMLHDFGVITSLYGKDPAHAALIWPALEAVETGMVSGNELVGSLWVALLSIAGLRAGILPRPLHILGLVLGAAGCTTLIPAVVAVTGPMLFGIGLIVWSIWLGVMMLRDGSREVEIAGRS